MPRLHKYLNRDAHYVLTRIDDAIITYQLTPAGETKLASVGIVPGQNFERALLLDLYRTGDAFTRGGEIAEAVIASQIEMDFVGDPNPESAFPTCDDCGSVADLRLTFTGGSTGFTARLQCPECQAKSADRPDASVPLEVMTRSLFARLGEVKGNATPSANVAKYEALLSAKFDSKWRALRRRRGEAQGMLFDGGEGGEPRLL